MSFFLYSETAFHHEGDVNYLIELINLTKLNGYDGVKFQVIGELAEYIVETHSQFSNLKRMVIPLSDWQLVIEYAKSLKLKVVFMPLDIKAMDWAIHHSHLIDFIDIHSVSFYDQPLLQKIKQSGKPVILGIGGRMLDEIQDSVNFFGKQMYCLMHGYQSFPTELSNARLLRIASLKGKFPNVLIGYADHSPYNSEDAVIGNEYAYLFGARVFEKHVTLNEGYEKTDYTAAVGSEKMIKIKQRLERLEKMSRDIDTFLLLADEVKYRERQKKLVASRKIYNGELITQENTVLKIIEENTDECYKNCYLKIKAYATRDIDKNKPILEEYITYNGGD